ncbi:MAG TPA: hypothetical protein VGI95_13320 [Caulobacteraceae bacterium]|jgi:hypothetical protein
MPAHDANQTRRPVRTFCRLPEQLFVGGCTAAYVVLIGAVAAALKLYAG